MRLENKNAVITGAAKGMGAEITLALAQEGANLLLAARDVAPLEEVAQMTRAMGRRTEIVRADVADVQQVAAMAQRADEVFEGAVDILVNVAGTTGPIETPVWDIKPEDSDAVIAVNIRGTYLPIKYILPLMIKRRSGKVVNIGGTSGLRGYKIRTAYSASKWAVRGITRTVALRSVHTT